MLHLTLQIAKAVEAPPGAVHVWLVFPNLCWKLCLEPTTKEGIRVLDAPKAEYGPPGAPAAVGKVQPWSCEVLSAGNATVPVKLQGGAWDSFCPRWRALPCLRTAAVPVCHHLTCSFSGLSWGGEGFPSLEEAEA